MPYKKELAKKRKLSPVALAYLSDSEGPLEDFEKGSLWCLRSGMPGFFDDDVDPKELWEKHRGDFLPEFIEKHPAKRPIPWWLFDAPRWNDPYKGIYFHGTLPEPRQRIGGTGTPNYEVLSYVPHFAKGIPTGWDEKSIDPDNPPIFESEASYLLRHDLLSLAEKRYLDLHPELLKPEKIIFDEKEN